MQLALEHLSFDAGSDASVTLLQLPDNILAVLQCLSGDPRSLFSAARAHSRLHQAAVLAASSIRAMVPQQQQVDSVLLYITNHGQHVDSIGLQGVMSSLYDAVGSAATLHQLPHHKLQGLSSLRFSKLHLQQPGSGFQGVLWAGAPLKQLRIHQCTLLDGEEGLAAALVLLPGLQHLSLPYARPGSGFMLRLPSSVLQGLQKLTYLELAGGELQDPGGLRHLQGLTRLQDLRLEHLGPIQVSMLSGLQHLTHLSIEGMCGPASVLSGVLADNTQLQHVELVRYRMAGGSAGVADMLSHLANLQQLTHLDLKAALDAVVPAAAYSALTASSKLQHLDVSHAHCQRVCGRTCSLRAGSCHTCGCWMLGGWSILRATPTTLRRPLQTASCAGAVRG